MKKTTSIVLGIMMLSSFSFAKDLTLDEAINLAIENNSSLISLNAEQRQQESDYKKVVRETRKWQKLAIMLFAFGTVKVKEQR